jgi:hypothetical protein
MSGVVLKKSLNIACGLVGFALVCPCHAHFLWVKEITQDGQQKAYLFFGESPMDEAYHIPEKLAKTKLWSRSADGKRHELALKNSEGDDRIGLVSPLKDDKSPVLETSQQYGIYGTSLLVYHAKHVRGKSADEWNAGGTSKDLKLEIVPRVEGDNATFTVLWDGKPLAKSKVTVVIGEGEQEEKESGDDGTVQIELEGDGVVGVLANYVEEGKSGELDGKKYNGVMHYASLTFIRGEAKAEAEKKAATGPKSAAQASTSDSNFPPLPEPLASFGASVADGWLYVYGGHLGEEHEHSAANLGKHFRRMRVDGSGQWEVLPMQTPLQGLPLVAHGGKIFRVGGLDARNATTDDEEDLHSVAEFAVFDPQTNEWTALAPLPAARSSHNAVVIGDKLYVAGGWRLTGSSPGEWQDEMLVYNLAKPDGGWQKLPGLPVKRRGLAVGPWRGRVIAIGGIKANDKTSQRVDIFDPETGKWSQGPDLPDKGLAGFGGSACELGGELYVSGLRGVLHRLSDDGLAWENAGRLAKPRFFHQLLPVGDDRLLAIGGASRDGHIADIERIEISVAASAPDARATTALAK